MTSRGARVWHTLTLLAALVAVGYQLWLVATGRGYVLDKTVEVPRGETIRRFFSYFTIQSNILVAIATAMIVAGRTEGPLFRVIRLASLIGITVTGVVAFIALTPPADFPASSLLADRLLHRVVPILAVIGWAVFGPRDKVTRGDVLPTLVWPVLWLVATLSLGPVFDDWYPYPFLNVAKIGLGQALLNCGVVALLFLALAAGVLWLDKRLPGERTSVTR